MEPVECPKCNSEETRVIGPNYPREYECPECGYTFVKGKQALIDE